VFYSLAAYECRTTVEVKRNQKYQFWISEPSYTSFYYYAQYTPLNIVPSNRTVFLSKTVVFLLFIIDATDFVSSFDERMAEHIKKRIRLFGVGLGRLEQVCPSTASSASDPTRSVGKCDHSLQYFSCSFCKTKTVEMKFFWREVVIV
jgi:hypothetical protein